jgi:putative DNA primase/helicase
MKTRAETFMVKRNDSIPEEVAQLVGVRFALAAELDEGQRLSESLVKDLTGGDKLRARHLYHDSFEFWPCAKLWLYGNHKPVIRGTDNGIWRRVQLIPFIVTIPKNEQDPDLPGKLKEELSGILNWALEGCVAWQKEGLEPPELVEAATNDYRAEQDVLAAFIDASCVIGQGKETKAADIYNAYKDWAVGNGEYCLSQRVFSQRLRERGFESSRKSNGVYYHGIGLLRPSNEG